MATTAPESAPAIQTGWTGVIAGLIDIFGKLDAETFLQEGRQARVSAGRKRRYRQQV